MSKLLSSGKRALLIIAFSAISIAFINANFFQITNDKGELVREIVHSKYLENTVTKESPDRYVSIYLPPSYRKSEGKRYPVLYLLHGIAGTDKNWTIPWSNNSLATISEIMDHGISSGKFGEMIVVMPDQKTNWFGSFYTNSSVTGQWEDFTTEELVNYIDTKYRTLDKPQSRGIAGHSMGGYGALMLAMKHPDVFSATYGLSSALIDFDGGFSINSDAHKNAVDARSFAELSKDNDLHTMAIVTISQAFSPNPHNPPFYADLPMKKVDGKMVINPDGYNRWIEKSPIRLVKKYQDNLKRLSAIALDAGDKDEFPIVVLNSRAYSNELKKYNIDHIYDEYSGNHRDGLWGASGRIYNNVLPFFWEILERN
ncbi:MAG: alpha/beta fold hydrolase [Bacteroidota bacterium]